MTRSLRMTVMVLAVFIAACTTTTDRGRSAGIQLRNLTDRPVEVTYHLVVETGNQTEVVANLNAGEVVQVAALHAAEGACLRGDLVATQNGREIARISRPCENTEWRIGDPAASAPGSPSP